MDRITENLVANFSTEYGLATKPLSVQFEYFANFVVLFEDLSDSFSLDDVHVGGDGNIGIDGAAIIVNGAFVSDTQEIDTLIATNTFLDVDFKFIQSKQGKNFDTGEMATFFGAVKDFFRDTRTLKVSSSIKELLTLKDYIYSRSVSMTNRNPKLALYYVTTGKWTNDDTVRACVDTHKKELLDTGLFHSVDFFPYDASALQRSFRATQGKSVATFTFNSRVTLPQQVDGVSEAHFGVIEATDFLKLIQDGNGNIKRTLFYDNVRDFQDFNEVNKEIKATLDAPTSRSLFPLLNNGVTIVARKVRPTGNSFHIEDYQIVNGCQTSHVLHHAKSKIGHGVLIPIKLIATDDDQVVVRIIKATNFQTEVKSEQLYALSDFQKKLEDYYATFKADQRLHYERRSMQYALSQIEKIRIVTIQQQMRAYTSMFLEEPHKGHYPKSVAPLVGQQIFGRDHLPDPYYLSAFALFKLESFFRNGGIDTKYKPARYHLLLGARRFAEGGQPPAQGSNKLKKYCEEIFRVVHDDIKLLQTFQNAGRVVDQLCAGRSLERTLTKTQPFTLSFIKALDAELQTKRLTRREM
jgi:hypothetical protein